MLRPSYSELMELLNDDRDLDSQITSRYTIVIAAAKRARQIVGGAPYEPDPDHKTDKAVSIAVDELGAGLVKLYPDGLPGKIADAKREWERQKGMRFYRALEEEESADGTVIELDFNEDEDEDDDLGDLGDDDAGIESYIFEPDEVDGSDDVVAGEE